MLDLAPQSANKFLAIDTLYSMILTGAFDAHGLELEEIKRIQCVLWTVVCAHAPLSIETLVALAQLESTRKAWVALQPLRSVLHVSGSETSGFVSTLHASFSEYLFSQERSERFFCDNSERNSHLARQCLAIMKNQLQSSSSELTLDDLTA